MLKRKINVAVVGAGAIAKSVHMPAYLRNSYVNLTAVVDSDFKRARNLAKKFHVKNIYQSCDELFKQQTIDAISLCTPPHTHEEIVLKSFDHNVHVLCEKPLTIATESGRNMVKAARTKKKILMVGCHRRFLPNYELAKKSILEGRLGDVYWVEDHFLEPHPLFGWARSPWYIQPGVGGVINDLGPHVFDMFNYLFDDFPIAVSAHGSTHLHSPVEELCAFLVEYPRKRLGVGMISWQSPAVVDYICAYGTGQSLYASPIFFWRVNPSRVGEISLLRAATDSLLSMKLSNSSLLSTKRVSPYKREIDSFVDQVRTGEVSDSNALNALSVLMACEATKEAFMKGCKIDIPPPRMA